MAADGAAMVLADERSKKVPATGLDIDAVGVVGLKPMTKAAAKNIEYHKSGIRVKFRLQGKPRCGPLRPTQAAVDADLAQIRSLESDEQKVVALARLVREAGAGRVRRGGKAIG